MLRHKGGAFSDEGLWVPVSAYSFLAFQNGIFWAELDNRHGEFHQSFLSLAIAGSRSANKGSAAGTLRVNSPPPEPMSLCTENGGVTVPV
jgi:hypothetical protein